MTLPHEIAATGPAAVHAAALQSALPVIETERLRLRAPRIEDFAFYAEITLSDRGRHILETKNREAAWHDFTQMVASWVLRGHGLWTIEARDGSEVLGFVLLGFEPGDHEPELGFLLRQQASGQGYAEEAAIAARAYAFDTLEMPTLVSTIDAENHASRRLAERLGGERDAAAEAAHDHVTLVYRYQGKGQQ